MFYRYIDKVVSNQRVTFPGYEIEVFHAEDGGSSSYCNEWHALNALIKGDGIRNEATSARDDPAAYDRPVGSMIFVPACSPSWFLSVGAPATYVTIRIAPSLVYSVSHAAGLASTLPEHSIEPFEDLPILSLIHKFSEVGESGKIPPSWVDSALNTLVTMIVKRFSGEDVEVTRTGGLSPARMLKVVEMVRAKLAAPLSIEDMAAVAEISADRFRHAFKITAGISPHKYLTSERIKRAQERLLGSDASLSDVALDCGFGSQAHFTTVFREVVGLTPGAYRRVQKTG